MSLEDVVNRTIKRLSMVMKEVMGSIEDSKPDIRILQRGRSTVIIEGKKPYQKRTEVKCKKGDPYDAETGVAMALLKHAGITRRKMYRIMEMVDRGEKPAGADSIEAAKEEWNKMAERK